MDFWTRELAVTRSKLKTAVNDVSLSVNGKVQIEK